MHQVAVLYWNDIVRSGHVQTNWALHLFSLDHYQLMDELDAQARLLRALGYSQKTVTHFQTLAPLLVEQLAISRYIARHQVHQLRVMLPEIQTVKEAVMQANRNNVLHADERDDLRDLLSQLLVGVYQKRQCTISNTSLPIKKSIGKHEIKSYIKKLWRRKIKLTLMKE